MSADLRVSYVDRVGLRCVIVDDNQGFLTAAHDLLEQQGVQVVGLIRTPEDAIGRVAELHPDVTLVDIDLGGASGFDVARDLTEHVGTAAGAILLISTHDEDEFLELIEASPAVGFIAKSQLSVEAISGLVT